jgi:hypothetical protein
MKNYDSIDKEYSIILQDDLNGRKLLTGSWNFREKKSIGAVR